jgi:hypothetical protein
LGESQLTTGQAQLDLRVTLHLKSQLTQKLHF